MPFPPSKKTMEGLLDDIITRLTLVERRLLRGSTPEARGGAGTTGERNEMFPPPTTDAERASLANRQVRWLNTTTGRTETYYAMSGTAGLTAPGLVGASFAAGWFPVPAEDWGGKVGPSAWLSAYKANWTAGTDRAGVIDAHSDSTRILIGMTGIYDVQAVQRGASTADYIAIAMNGDRTIFENRVGGLYTHDHAAGTNNHTQSMYLGPINAGESVTAGSPTTGGGLVYGTGGILGRLVVRRVS